MGITPISRSIINLGISRVEPTVMACCTWWIVLLNLQHMWEDMGDYYYIEVSLMFIWRVCMVANLAHSRVNYGFLEHGFMSI